MESEGINVLKLNTGNPGRFGFKLPNSVRQALAQHLSHALGGERPLFTLSER